MRKLNNKKGVALLLVAGLILVAVPVTMLMLNLSKSQKEQTTHYNNVLNVEQISLSGINMGYSKLKSGYDRGYKIFPGEISGKDRFDLNMTPTGTGFFKQDIYLLLSKAKEGKNSSIIMADAEQFQEEDPKKPVLVITHDYWSTPENRELSAAKDVIAMKNFRGADQLRALDVKKFEMECDESKYKSVLNSLKSYLSSDIGDVWDTVVENASNDKIYGEETPQPEKPGAGYGNAAARKGRTSPAKNNPSQDAEKRTAVMPPDSGLDATGMTDEEARASSGSNSSSSGSTHYDDRGFQTNTGSTGNTTADIERAKGEARLRQMELQ